MDAALRYGVLGPVTVHREGTPHRVTAAMPRTVLSALLLAESRPVSVERLVAVLWGDRPPPSARASLHNTVLRVRRLLGPDAERLRAVPPGYLLEVEHGELDLAVFADLHLRGRDAHARRAWTEVAGLLGAALELWRGDPLADVQHPVLDEAEHHRLAEMRLQALDWRIDAELHLGRHQAVLPELHALTRAHPLRERFHGHLMSALYRTGRQADALAAYRHARAVLSEELGLDPGEELQGLHQRILARDPGLLPAAQRPPAADRPLAQLPADVADFTGRETQVRRVLGLLRPDGDVPAAVVVSAVTGTGGIGKTTLAVHLAHRLAAAFPDGQLYLDLRGADPAPPGPAELLGGLLRDLGVPDAEQPAGAEARAARYRSLLAGRRLLLLLDNARDAAQVRPLLPGHPGCAVLVTSRNRLSGLAGAVFENLDVLVEAEARALFTAVVGAARVEAEPEAAGEVLRHCAGLPLAVRIAAARLAARPSWTVAHLAGRLADERGRLDEFSVDDVAVRTGFRMSYANLPPEPARVFRLLGLFPGREIGLPAAAALAGAGRAATERALELLVDASLLESPAPGSYRFHDLLRTFARECAEAEEEPAARTEAVRRLLAWYLHTAERAMEQIHPLRVRIPLTGIRPPASGLEQDFDCREGAVAWCEAERATAVAATRLADGLGLADEAWLLPATLLHFFNMRAHWTDWVECSQLGLANARRAGAPLGECWMLIALSVAHRALGEHPAALAESEDALAAARTLGDPRTEAITLDNLAGVLHLMGRNEEAIEHYGASLRISREMGRDSAVASTLNNLGLAHHALGRHAEAIALYTQALGICRTVPAVRFVEAAVLDGLGQSHAGLGRTQEALDALEQAIAIRRELGDPAGEASSLDHLADVLAAGGRTAEARDAWLRALELLGSGREARAAEVRRKLAGTGGAGPAPP